MAASERAVELARLAAGAALDKKGVEPVAFDVSERLAITDAFLIVSASNERQVGAIVDGIEEALLGVGAKPVGREGVGDNRWVLLDYLDLIAHVQHSEERSVYSLERLWKDCPEIPLEPAAQTS
ncbi:MAG: ribosome silencing factor [Propionibacteriaceae bacterium]|jgi:ribosome-associated protein|nr:ribosome silencing factor [Propionibacteriaceae bacterium]